MQNNQRQKQPKEPRALNGYSLIGIVTGGIIGAGFFLGSSLSIRQADPSIVFASRKAGIYIALLLLLLLPICSLNVPDFRMSFAVFMAFVFMLSVLHWLRKLKPKA